MAEKLQLDVETAIFGGDSKPGQKTLCHTDLPSLIPRLRICKSEANL